jgi:hypothetical protein
MTVASYLLFSTRFFSMICSTLTVSVEYALFATVLSVPDNFDIDAVDVSYFTNHNITGFRFFIVSSNISLSKAVADAHSSS